MQEEFRPFLLLSPLAAKDARGRCFPAEVRYIQTDRRTYEAKVEALEGDSFIFERLI